MAPPRKPLSVMIALGAKKPPASDEAGGDEDGGSEHMPDDAEIGACEDVIDAVKHQDAEALSKALANWMDIYESMKGGGESDESDAGSEDK